ncbi:MAG TPA: peptidylprolyl isomerase, partial [Candidatus Saccharimonadales bacterium]|nr:peptidylprolyl isomerase [Candidatus Saccharimonadales bacterium]
LRDYWGWSIDDFKRSLKEEILSEKVAAKLDTADHQKAALVISKVSSPKADFSALARKYSDDPGAKNNGGDYGFPISRTNPNVPPEVVGMLFKMKVGQISGIILASPVLANQGPSLQIVELTGVKGDSVTARHITINLKDISAYVKPLEKQKPSHPYVHF